MFDYITRLRELPESARRKKALLISVSITLLIAILWGVGLFFSMEKGKFSIKAEEVTEEGAPGIVTTFSRFFGGIGNVFDGEETYENTAATYQSQ